MLKRRIIPLLLWLNGRVVKTVSFRSPAVVGKLESLAAVYSDQDADELIIVDISPRQDTEPSPIYHELERLIERVQCPVAFGGNVQTMTEAVRLFQLGVEKICLPSHHLTGGLVAQVGEKFGSQAVTVSLDFLEQDNATQVVTNRGTRPTEQDLFKTLEMCRENGAGELLVQDVRKDGTGSGLNLKVLSEIRHRIEIPLIGAGGVGNSAHIKEGLDIGLDAVACGTLFNFGDNNPLRVKSALRNKGFPLKISAEIPLPQRHQ